MVPNAKMVAGRVRGCTGKDKDKALFKMEDEGNYMEAAENHTQSEKNNIQNGGDKQTNIKVPSKPEMSPLIIRVLAMLRKPRSERKHAARELKLPWRQYRWLEEKCKQRLQQKTQSLS